MNRRSLPPDDYVRVKPLKRTREQLRVAVVLKILTIVHWDLVLAEGPTVVEEALQQARFHGRGWEEMTPKGDGGLVDYCEYVVSAAKIVKVINEVEFQLWFSNPADDPRLLEFRRGFLEAKKERRRKRAKRKRRNGN
jgi:hypothetical protein